MIIKTYIKRILGKFLCLIGDHDWTSKAEQGIPPDYDKRDVDPIGYFKEYAAMYCSRCNKKSKHNL
jgi:hypothetical protein